MRQSNGSWSEVQKITPDDRAENDQFGISVSLSGDMGVIGSWWDDQDADDKNTIKNSGSAYIIEKDEEGAWPIAQKIVADDRSEEAGFGSNVFIENQTIFAGVGFEDYNSEGTDSIKNAGAVYMFEPTGPASIIGKEKITNDFIVYPNPVTNKLFVDLSGIISPNGMINIINIDGRVMKSFEVTGTGIISLDVSHLPKGIYLCR
ncbi:MAG: T9SS type A sorting domain-containing protein, partial [Bacteroidota bacterium]